MAANAKSSQEPAYIEMSVQRWKNAKLEVMLMGQGGEDKFLKKLWCCVDAWPCGANRKISFYQVSWQYKLATIKSFQSWRLNRWNEGLTL